MNVIDHGILIPVPPDRVWHILSDINRISEWHTDCRSVAFLTSLRSGPGTRWRLTNKRGHEYVLEITTWYDRLGYEYRYVDGVSLKENRGLLRLQEVPEGTVVQWTFNYRPKGLLGATGLGSKRAINSLMVDSLRSLYRYLTKPTDTSKTAGFEAKSLMRDAPDVEARQHYRPRHPSVLQENESADTGEPATQPNVAFTRPISADSAAVYPPVNTTAEADFLDPFYEPPVKEGDTRPHPAPVVDDAEGEGDAAVSTHSPTLTPIPAGIDEPDFLKDQPDAVFTRRPSDTIKLQPPTPLDDKPISEPLNLDGPTRVGITPPSDVPADHPAKADATGELPWIPPRPAAQDRGLQGSPNAGTVSNTENLPSLPRLDADEELDTSKVSVFEIFGLPKPSETQEMRAVTANVTAETPAAASAPSTTVESAPTTPKSDEDSQRRDGATLPLPFLPIAPPPFMDEELDEDERDEVTEDHQQRNEATTMVAALVDSTQILDYLPAEEDDSLLEHSTGRVGLRAAQRRKTVKLRLPQS